MKNLKPCPFCRGEALEVVSERYTPVHYFIKCEQCRARSFYFRTPAEAVAAWNRRTPEWIPVEEELPGICRPVLVYCPQNRLSYCASINPKETKWYIWGGEQEEVMFDVSHWMPLPEPPEGWKEGER